MASLFSPRHPEALLTSRVHRDPPITVETLRAELATFAHAFGRSEMEGWLTNVAGLFREELCAFEDRVREVVRMEIAAVRTISRDDSNHSNGSAADAGLIAFRKTTQEWGRSGTSPLAPIMAATDWVTKRRMNAFYKSRRKPPRAPAVRRRAYNFDASRSMAHQEARRMSSEPSSQQQYETYNHLPSSGDFGLDDEAELGFAVSREGTERSLTGHVMETGWQASMPLRFSTGSMPLVREVMGQTVPSVARTESANPSGRRSSDYQHVLRGRLHALNQRPSEFMEPRRGSTLEERLVPVYEATEPGSDDAVDELAVTEMRSSTRPLKERGCMERIVTSAYFEYTSCCFVLSSTVFLGIQTDYLASRPTEDLPLFFDILDKCFCGLFLMELLTRIYVHRCHFFCGDGWQLNLFDMLLVMLQVVDEAVQIMHLQTADGVSLLRNFRILRFLRILRLTRVLSFIGELRTLVVSIASSLKSLIWVIILLAMLTYSFGMFLTHVVTTQKAMHGGRLPESQADLTKFYGSVQRSMLSLFEAVSEGVHWSEVMDPLVEYCSPWMVVVFLCYIVFAVFALLNVVTGLFVEAAIATATEDKKIVLMQQMCQMFLDCDDDNSGTVSWEEFKEHLDKPQMETYLKELDIDKQEAPMLFHLLDGDGAGEIGAEELVGGCMRLHGSAKALELAAFMHEFRQFQRQWIVHAKHLEEALHVTRPISKDHSPKGPGSSHGREHSPGGGTLADSTPGSGDDPTDADI